MARYSKGAGKAVESAMKRMEKGTLRSGRSRKKVTDPRQAIAIGLSEAREKGAKVPKKKAAVKAGVKKKAATIKKTPAKKAKPIKKKGGVSRKPEPGKRAGTKKTAKERMKKAAPATGRKTIRKPMKKKPEEKASVSAKKKRGQVTTHLRPSGAETDKHGMLNQPQTELLVSQDPLRMPDQKAFDKYSTKGDPRKHLPLSSKPRNPIKPSGKKPLFH